MGSNVWSACEPYALSFIQMRVRQLLRQHKISTGDRDDVCQDLILHALRQLPQYNENRATIKTFIARVIDSKIATILAARRAAKRHAPGGIVSLDDNAPSGDGQRPRLNSISNDDFLQTVGRFVRTVEEQIDLEIDTRRAIAILPTDLQVVAELLMVMSVTEAASNLGVPRTTLDYWRVQIRRKLEKSGLAEYL